ncbi:uncharacterized protein [Solanum lycopersicum]|uniref:uncharacterized protein isoform X8 n=1 Tax=Solanum lycopersicum TaxID=4081 RepID=UPI003749A0FF
MDDSRSTVDYLTSDLNFSSKSSIRSTIEYLTTDLNFSSNSSISRKNCFLTFLQLMAYTLDDGRHTAIPGICFWNIISGVFCCSIITRYGVSYSIAFSISQ